MVLYILATMLIIVKIIGVVFLLGITFIFLQLSCDTCDQIRRARDEKTMDDLKILTSIFMCLGILSGFGCYKLIISFWGG